VVREGAWLSGSVAAGEKKDATKPATMAAPFKPAAGPGGGTATPGETKRG